LRKLQIEDFRLKIEQHESYPDPFFNLQSEIFDLQSS